MQAGPGLPGEASNANRPQGQVPGGAGGDFAAGISGSVCINHLWPVVAGGGGMTTDKALDLALEVLKAAYVPADLDEQREKAITAIKQARALDKKAENARELGLDYEPVIAQDGDTLEIETILYTSPQRTWVGLTDEEMQALWDRYAHMEMMRAIEAKLKERNV
jgi:hypothetical protein